jgi:hypothetical protein
MRPEVQVLLGPHLTTFVRPLGDQELVSGTQKGVAMKRVLALAAAVGALVLLKRRKGSGSSDVWRDATRPDLS